MTKPTSDSDELLAKEVAGHKVGNRTDSAAMLSWFLQHVLRIEPEDVDDAICDGGGDKGIDALVVDDDLNEITILQGKHRSNPGKSTQGDNDLKSFVGVASWFESPQSVLALMNSKPNAELLQLLKRQAIAEKIEQGSHLVRLVFVTNAPLDQSGMDYCGGRVGSPTLEVWDRGALLEVADRIRRPDLRAETVVLETSTPPITLQMTEEELMGIAVVSARQLVKLPGIADHTLFSRNVRLFAGRTRINRELKKTVQTLDEHRLFPAYHNGLTLLTNNLKVDGNTLRLERVGVVNGCQSLMTLHENASSITDDLRLLVKVVEVGDDSKVADLITYRSNNQNTVTLRDQRSSDSVMRDLQQGVRDEFGSKFALRTRVGEEQVTTEVLENTLAAQLIMAAYLREPWAAVRKVKLFDQEYRRIFNKSVTPYRLRLAYLLDQVTVSAREELRPSLRASFASIRFTIVHLICEVLRISTPGEQLLNRPERWLKEEEATTTEALGAIAREVVENVNYYVDEEITESDGDFDPKVAFKSKSGVARLETYVARDARRQARRDDQSYLFTVTPTLP